MSCSTCLGRRTFARRFYPQRRPLYVRCYSCKRRRAERWRIVQLVAAVTIGAPLVCAGMVCLVDIVCSALKAWLA